MPGERKPAWFWELDRWNLTIACALLVVLVAASAAALLQDGTTGLSGLSSPLAIGQSPLPAAGGRGAAGFATPPSPAEAAAAIAAAGTSAARQGVVTAAPATLQAAASSQSRASAQTASLAPSTRTPTSTPQSTRTPVWLGNLTVLPPVFVPEAAWPVSRPGAPAIGSLTGSAPPGAVVRIYDGSALLGQARADVDNGWRFPLRSTLQPGRHVLSATFDYTGTLPSAAGGASGAAATLTPISRPVTIVFSVPVVVSASGEATAP
jgi:large repetitive protein